MPDKEEITAVLTVKVLISNSKDRVSRTEKTLHLKNPKEEDLKRGYYHLTNDVIAAIKLHLITASSYKDSMFYSNHGTYLKDGESEERENEKEVL